MDDLTQRIEQTWQQLIDCTERAMRATETLEKAKEDLAWKRAECIISGVPGKNADEREANLRYACETEVTTLATAEKQHRFAKGALEVAQVQAEMVRLHLRCAELAAESGVTVYQVPPGPHFATMDGGLEYRSNGNAAL